MLFIPYKHWKLKSKILLLAIFPTIIAATLATPYFTRTAIKSVEVTMKYYVIEIANRAALAAKNQIDKIALEASFLSKTLEGIADQKNVDENLVDTILQNIAEDNPWVTSAWSIWGQEFMLINKKSTLVHYWSVISGKLQLVQLTDVEQFKKEKRIDMVINLNQPTLLSPYINSVQGNDTLYTSIAYPIFNAKKQVIGVVGVDIDLSKFQPQINSLISKDTVLNAGLVDDTDQQIVRSPPLKRRALNSPMKDFWEEAKISLQKGQNFYYESFEPHHNQDIYRIISPIKPTGFDKTWALFVSLPLDPIKRDIYKEVVKTMMIVCCCILLGIFITLLTVRKIVKPLTQIIKVLESISSGDYSVAVPEVDSLDEIGQISKAAKVFKRTSEELNIAKDQAEMANKAKTEFLANMSHELRTPMHAILSYSKLAIKKAEVTVGTKIYQYLNNIIISGERLLKLLNNLLDLSKLEAGKVHFDMKKNNILSVIEMAAAELNSLLMEHNVITKIINNLSEPEFVFDKESMMQVIINILSNAIKFSPTNGNIYITLDEAEIETDIKQSAIKISIEDEGIGVPEGELKSIFDKFVQSSKTKKGSGGTGLGLSIAKNIVMAHDGMIWAEHGQQKGTRINIILPIKSFNNTEAL